MRKITLYYIASIILLYVLVMTIFRINVINSARITARYELSNLRHCINTDLSGMSSITDFELFKSIRKCGQKSLITRTGDIFAVDLKTDKFIFDPSSDCFLPNKKLTKDSVCTLFSDPNSCVEALEYLKSGQDSDEFYNTKWKFLHDSYEYLEWKILPNVVVGYDGVYKGSNKLPHQILLVQGIIEKELFARYKLFIRGFQIVIFIIIIFILLESKYSRIISEHKKDKKDKEDGDKDE